MSVTQADHDRVWFVTVTRRDGRVEELAFPNKTAAALFLADIPRERPDVARAMLRPSGHSHN